ncbi:MAG: hypothetical protein RMJ48_04160 [Roseiflexaceae bacterium]|nr:hypothetical protein [Roseiflexaceae bacterium]
MLRQLLLQIVRKIGASSGSQSDAQVCIARILAVCVVASHGQEQKLDVLPAIYELSKIGHVIAKYRGQKQCVGRHEIPPFTISSESIRPVSIRPPFKRGRSQTALV